MTVNLKLHHLSNNIAQLVDRARLAVALGLVVLIALVLTVLSVVLYSIGGYSRFDLSRPGYERERTQVTSGDAQQVYDTTSPVTKDAIDSFLKEYDSRAQEIHGYGDFRDQALDDNDLQLNGPGLL